MKRIGTCIVLVGCLTFASSGAAFAAEETGRAYGIRVGYGHRPDQFVAGFQADLGKAYKNIHFVPSIDAGFGEHVTTVGFNGDFKVYLPLPKASAALYFLAGPAIEYWSPDKGDADTEIGVYLGGGIRAGLGNKGWYNLETRFGVGDVPDFRILLGILLGGR